MPFGQVATRTQSLPNDSGVQYFILACGVHACVPPSLNEICVQEGWSFCRVETRDEVIEKLSSTPVSVFLLFETGDQSREILKAAKECSPATTRIFLSTALTKESLAFAINEVGIMRVLAADASTEALHRTMIRAIEDYVQRVQESGLLKQVSRQNRKLEELRTNLESIVQERTQSIERSKDQAEEQQRGIRELVRFIKDLARVGSIPDIVYLLRRELRRLNGILDPTLGFVSHDRTPYLVTFRGSQLYQKAASQILENVSEPRFNHTEDRQYLANQLGRPIAKLIVVPLHGRVSTPAAPLLFIEHNLGEAQARACLESLRERLPSLGVAIDRVIVGHQLHVAALYWESTFDAISNPVAIIDIDYRVLRSNRHFSATTYETQCHKLLSGSETPCVGCPVRSAFTTGQPARSQVKVQDRIYEVNAYPIKLLYANQTTTVVNQYRDITEDRRLYGQMLQNEKMVALGLLAGNLAHELNNPLTGLKSMSQVLQLDERVNERLKADLKEIEDASDRCQRIVKNLFEFSQLPGEAQVRVVSLNSVVDRTMPLLKTAMRIHNREVYLGGDDILIEVDPNLLSQVVFNLVNNACQAMKDPGTITIRTERIEKSAHLYISDTGSGISPEILPKIFEPFFTTKPEGEGTGIGLSMSLSIVQRFGGKIGVQSRVGQGTTFDVELPLQTEKAQYDVT